MLSDLQVVLNLIFFFFFLYVPSVDVRSEDHVVIFCDVNDAVLSLDGHPAQLDVLRVGGADTRVLLHVRERETHTRESKDLSVNQLAPPARVR